MAAYRLENRIRFCARPCKRLQDSGNSTIVQQQICRRKPKDDFESTSTQVQIAWVQLELIPIKVPKMIQQQHPSSSGSKKSGKLGSAQALPCFVICSWEWKTEFMGLQKLGIEGAQPSVLVVSGLHSSQEAGCCFEPSGKQPYIIEESW